MTRMHYDQDADLGLLKGKRVAIIGYGSQGHAQAQNLRDSGIDVIVSDLKGSENYDRAVRDGFEPVSASEAASAGDLIQMLVPDEVQARVYRSDIEKHLAEGKILVFSHGFNIHFNQIVPPKNVDVIMIAPKGPGHLVRRVYIEGGGGLHWSLFIRLLGRSQITALAYAKGIGATRAGVIETTFKEETETDLFGEQVVLCGGMTELVRAGFETLVEAGYQPEIAYFECLHELKLIVDLMYEGGISWMRYSISDTAEYGDMVCGKRVITTETRKEMKRILEDIQTGRFAREWILENQANRPIYNALKKKESEHLIEVVGAKLRSMMIWIKKKE